MDGAVRSNVAVVGGGAVGKLVAASFGQAGLNPVLVVRRPDQARLIKNKGIVLHSQNGDSVVVPVRVRCESKDLETDLVILTVKSFDTETAASEIAKLPGVPKVLSLQNGLGNGEILTSYLDEDRIFVGLTTYGATSLSDNEVAARGIGELVVGGFRADQSGVTEILNLFSMAGWNVRVGVDIKKEIWSKALVNIGINPITAIYRIPNGGILERPELKELAVQAVREAGEVAVSIGTLNRDEVEAAVDRMLKVCKLTAFNRSSMLQDVEMGRRTEIDSLNGQIVRLGDAHSLPVPVNRELWEQLKGTKTQP